LCSHPTSKACTTSISKDDDDDAGKPTETLLNESSLLDFGPEDLIATNTLGQETRSTDDTPSAMGSYGFTVVDPIVVERWEDRPYGTREKPIVILDGVHLGGDDMQQSVMSTTCQLSVS